MLKRLLISIMLSMMIGSASVMANGNRQEAEPKVANTSELPEIATVSNKTEELISRNIFVEIGGPSLGVGIGYDQRFRPTSVFGFRAGLSFTNGSWDDKYDGGAYTDLDFKGVTIPLEANAILGKRASKFEVGLGVTPCILHRHEVKYWGYYPDNSAPDVKDRTRINIFGTLNVGYRLQRKSGFFLRAGFTFLIGDLKCSPIDGLILVPNIALGYTIR